MRHLNLAGCTTLQRLPNGLRCYDLNLQHTHIRSLPDDIQVEYRLDLEGCHELAELPAQLKVGLLVLRECTALQHLPEGLDVYSRHLRVYQFARMATTRFRTDWSPDCTWMFADTITAVVAHQPLTT